MVINQDSVGISTLMQAMQANNQHLPSPYKWFLL